MAFDPTRLMQESAIPPDWEIHAGAPDDRLPAHLGAQWAIALGTTGPVRVHHLIPAFQQLITVTAPVNEMQRTHVLLDSLHIGAISTPPPRIYDTWAALGPRNRMMISHLGNSGQLGDWPVIKSMLSIVTPRVWTIIENRISQRFSDQQGDMTETILDEDLDTTRRDEQWHVT